MSFDTKLTSPQFVAVFLVWVDATERADKDERPGMREAYLQVADILQVILDNGRDYER